MAAEDFFERVKRAPHPVVVDFWAPWCAPCRAIDPVVKKLGKDYAGRVDVWKVNADEQPEVLRSLRIYSIPTLVAFKDGQEVARRTGAASPAIISTLFDAALSGERPAKAGPKAYERVLRLVAGFAVLYVAYQGQFTGWYVVLAGLGAIIAFSAVYDRCPIYKAISGLVKDWLSKASSN